jgi:hypothetical protein
MHGEYVVRAEQHATLGMCTHGALRWNLDARCSRSCCSGGRQQSSQSNEDCRASLWPRAVASLGKLLFPLSPGHVADERAARWTGAVLR